jgi:hypothetical protein
MRLLTWAALIGGGYYLYQESKKSKPEPKPGVNTPGIIVPEGDEGSLYVEGGGMYLDTALPGDVIIDLTDPNMLEGLGNCCNNCRRGAPCCGG